MLAKLANQVLRKTHEALDSALGMHTTTHQYVPGIFTAHSLITLLQLFFLLSPESKSTGGQERTKGCFRGLKAQRQT